MNSNILKFTLALAAFVWTLLPPEEAKGQTQIGMTELYSPDVPVQIEGEEYVWLCLDVLTLDPFYDQYNYYLSADPGSASVGNLSGIPTDQMAAIGTALKNIYLNNQAWFLDNTVWGESYVDSPGYFLQAAAWYLTGGARANVWTTSTLDSAAINDLLADGGLEFIWDDNPPSASFGDLLRSGLVSHPEAENWDVLFGIPAEDNPPIDNPDYNAYQPLMFLSTRPVAVPEPSLVSLISLTGIALIGRRRRK